MNFFSWFSRDRSARNGVLSLYKSGLTRIKKNDQQGAMNDFNAAISAESAPADVKAMALYNRALLFAAANDISQAINDLNAILAMPEPLRDVKLAARRRLERMRHRQAAEDSALERIHKSH